MCAIMSEELPFTLLIKLGGGEASDAQLVAGLFAFCKHDYFRYGKPPIESRIKALRFLADTLEINSSPHPTLIPDREG